MADATEKADVIAYMKEHRVWSSGDAPILRSIRRTKMWLRRLERMGVTRAERFIVSETKKSVRYSTRWVYANPEGDK